MSQERIEQLRQRLANKPAVDDRHELARLLVDNPEARAEAREHCFAVIADRPNDVRCRVLLARLFYLDKYTEFAIREIVEACRRRNVPSLHRLLEGFGQASAPYLCALASSLEKQPGQAVTFAPAAAGASKSAAAPAQKVEAPVEEEAEIAEIDLDSDMLEILDQLDEVSDD